MAEDTKDVGSEAKADEPGESGAAASRAKEPSGESPAAAVGADASSDDNSEAKDDSSEPDAAEAKDDSSGSDAAKAKSGADAANESTSAPKAAKATKASKAAMVTQKTMPITASMVESADVLLGQVKLGSGPPPAPPSKRPPPPPPRPQSSSRFVTRWVGLAVVVVAVVVGVLLIPWSGDEMEEAVVGAPPAEADLGPSRPGQPSARDPFSRPVPQVLQPHYAKVSAGEPLDRGAIRELRSYQRQNAGDPRASLILAHDFVARAWLTDALTRYEQAFEKDPACRGNAWMREDLVRVAESRSHGARAANTIVQIYGPEALPTVEGRLGDEQLGPGRRARLQQLADRLR